MNALTLSNLKRSGKSSAPDVARELPVAGLTPFTSIDFPGHLAAVVYTQGCAWRCRYCHNPHLQPFGSEGLIPLRDVFGFLEPRKGLLDGVVFCGGEPTAHEGLEEVMRRTRAMGFKIALHTTGMIPARLKQILPLCDWVGMDIKSPFGAYPKITQRPEGSRSIQKSIRHILESHVSYEFRTTVHPALLSETDIGTIGEQLSRMGVENFALQRFRAKGCADDELNHFKIHNIFISIELRNKLSVLFKHFITRL